MPVWPKGRILQSAVFPFIEMDQFCAKEGGLIVKICTGLFTCMSITKISIELVSLTSLRRYNVRRGIDLK